MEAVLTPAPTHGVWDVASRGTGTSEHCGENARALRARRPGSVLALPLTSHGTSLCLRVPAFSMMGLGRGWARWASPGHGVGTLPGPGDAPRRAAPRRSALWPPPSSR